MTDPRTPTAEHQRLADARERGVPWRRWGPYVSERQWGTVREDYSADGDAWNFLSYEQARSRAYRWGEDGIAGICDEQQRLCFALTLWNGVDPMLKERLFGLSGPEGNHGEDVKEYYFYLDNLPSHAYMKFLYKYPQQAFPYQQLRDENRRRSRREPEFELLDTGIFDDDRYFDVFVEYAKAAPDDLLVRIRAVNRGPDAAVLQLLPTLWFRNTWSWKAGAARPLIAADAARPGVLCATHAALGPYWLYFDAPDEVLFTDNDSNRARLWGQPPEGFAKDAFHDYLIAGRTQAVNRAGQGTKAAPRYRAEVGPGQAWVIKLRLSSDGKSSAPLGEPFDALFTQRIAEADAFYRQITPFEMPDELRRIQRQAFAGLLWSKQFYHYNVQRWLDGDPSQPAPPAQRRRGRNQRWAHLDAADVMAMPDKWEYPWFASWDMAFHSVAYALIDADFAKRQLTLLTRAWVMHPNGQIPAYEWNFGDVNPPVHAWAALRVCQIEQKMTGRMDHLFLERIFQKLLINFTWWVNREDTQGDNLFEGGFLGLDNISIVDRSAVPPSLGHLEQADGSSWMAMYCLNMLAIALELAAGNPAYEDIATKFFEHFVYIGAAINRGGDQGPGLWSEDQGYYFDRLRLPDGSRCRIDAFTIAGLVPLFAIVVGDSDSFRGFREFAQRFAWFRDRRPELLGRLADIGQRGVQQRLRLALVDEQRLRRLLERVLDAQQLLAPGGVRSVSRRHAAQPFTLQLEGHSFTLDYEPAESTSAMFGGNSNWRGPVWMPLNFLLIESLQKHDYFYGDDLQLPLDGPGHSASLWQVAAQLSQRLIGLFTRDANGRRAVYGRFEKFQTDPHWRDLILFHEYFDGDTGMGLGASHQTGWTALVAKLIQQHAEYALQGRPRDAQPR
jgi:hypothetical protein